MNRSAAVFLIVFALLAGRSAQTLAQAPSSGGRPAPPAEAVQSAPVFQITQDARETRERLQELLRQYPPALREVLQIDHSLLGRPDYLAPYPQLVAFIQQHPEVTHDPTFFIGERNYRERTDKERAFEQFRQFSEQVTFLIGFVLVVTLLFTLLRQLIEYRRWLRQTRLQTDVHTKLLDRLTNHEDLFAYIQSPAGRRFLESTPISVDGEARSIAAPLGRILWSIQAGIVLAALGIGLWFVQRSVIEEIALGFNVMGTVAFAVGVGFVISAVVSYLLSLRLGLMGVSKAQL